MHESEIWITRIFNDYLPGVGNFFLGIAGQPAQARPWATYVTMELMVAAIIVILFAVLKTRLSADAPGKFQQTFELVYEFVNGQAEEQVGHSGHHYLGFFGTIFIFVLFSNLIGVIPGLEAPTMYAPVPLGCAAATFLYYNFIGLKQNGPIKYAAHFAGPVWWLAPLMFPIEVVSHMARPLSLTIRLYANMFAGEKITTVFLGLTYFVIPALFMGLHVFVSLIQAYVFMVLAMMYVGAAVAHEH